MEEERRYGVPTEWIIILIYFIRNFGVRTNATFPRLTESFQFAFYFRFEVHKLWIAEYFIRGNESHALTRVCLLLLFFFFFVFVSSFPLKIRITVCSTLSNNNNRKKKKERKKRKEKAVMKCHPSRIALQALFCYWNRLLIFVPPSFLENRLNSIDFFFFLVLTLFFLFLLFFS